MTHLNLGAESFFRHLGLVCFFLPQLWHWSSICARRAEEILLFLVSSQFYLVVFVSLLFGCLLGLGVAVQLVKLVI